MTTKVLQREELPSMQKVIVIDKIGPVKANIFIVKL